MSLTPIYQFEYFVPNEIIGNNLDLDKNRFTTIENQLYNLYNIFGNGVLSYTDSTGNTQFSWLLSQVPNEKTIRVSIGKGHIAWVYAETTAPVDINLIVPSGVTSGTFIYYFYATQTKGTPVDKTVNFIQSPTQISDPNYYIGLGAATLIINADGTFSITVYNDAAHGRQDISIFSTLTSLVKNHVHIGGPNEPSPIDLSKHVTGLLSSDNIDQIDLGKVKTGTLDPNRLPAIDHNSLLNIGTLTHSQIDSLLAALQLPGQNYRISDIGIVNRLQIILALKRQTGFFNIDAEQYNSIFYVPYTQLAGFVDSNTTAIIDTNIHRVYGTSGVPKQSNVIKISSTQDFITALFNAQDSVISPQVNNLQVTGITSVPIAGTVNSPYGITGSANTIYISSTTDSFISSFTGLGTFINRKILFDTTNNLNLNSPMSVYYDSVSNYLYIADTFNHRIIISDGNLNYYTTVPFNAKGVPGGTNGVLGFSYPKGVFGLGNTFYISDSGNNQIQKWNWINGVAVYNTTYSYSNNTITGIYQPLSDPRGIFATTFNNNNFIFVADYQNHRVLCGIETNGSYSVYQVLGDNSAGYGIYNTSLITYTPTIGSIGTGAAFSFSTSINNTIQYIGVTSKGYNHTSTDTYNINYSGVPVGLIYIYTDGAGGVNTAYVKYGISSNFSLGLNHPVGLALSNLGNRLDLLISDTDNNRIINYHSIVQNGLSTSKQFAYSYNFGSVGVTTDSNGNIYFERPAGIFSLGFSTVYVADNLNNRINYINTSTGFSTNTVGILSGNTFGIADTSMTAGGLTLLKPFNYVGIANTVQTGVIPNNWYIGEQIGQSASIVGDTITRFTFTTFSSPISLTGSGAVPCDTIAVAFNTLNEIFPNQSLGKIDCYLVYDPSTGNGNPITFTNTNYTSNIINISNLQNLRYWQNNNNYSTQTIFSTIFNLSQLTINPNAPIIGFGFIWSTITGWNNSINSSIQWGLPQFSSSYLLSNYPSILTYRQNYNHNEAVFAFNANQYAASAYFVFRYDSGTNATFDYTILNFSQPTSNGNKSSLVVYYRVDNTLDALNSDPFLQISDSTTLSGQSLNINASGRYIDIIAQFNATPDLLAAPVISSLALYYEVYGQSLGIIYDTNVKNPINGTYPRFKWSQGAATNINVSPVIGDNSQSYQISIANTSLINQYLYLSNSNALTSDINYNEQYLIDVNNLYLSPIQLFTGSQPGITNAQHIISNNNNGYIIADTDNDRVLNINQYGELIAAIQGNIKLSRSNRDFVVLGSYYNTNVQQLYLIFSQYFALNSNYLSQLSIYCNGINYQLNNSAYFDQLNNGLFKININSKSAIFYINVTVAMDTVFNQNPQGCFFQIQNPTTNPPFILPTTGRSDGFPLENQIITYSNSSFNEFVYNSNIGFGTILNFTQGISFTSIDPTIFGQNTNSPSSVLLSASLINQNPPYANFYSLQVQVLPIYFDNIFKPIFVDYTDNQNLIVTTVGNAAIRGYTSNYSNLYTVSLTQFSFNEKIGGSAYVMDRSVNQSGKILLIALPTNGINTIIGNVYLFNRSNNSFLNQFSYNNLDTVKALPTPDNSFLILINDRISGLKSNLLKVAQDGAVNASYGNVFTQPVSLSIKENGNYYVSDTTGQIGTIYFRSFIADGSGNSTNKGISTSSSSSSSSNNSNGVIIGNAGGTGGGTGKGG